MKYFLFFIGLMAQQNLSAQRNTSAKNNMNKERLQIAAAMEKSVRKELLDVWYPKSFDTINGGFITAFTYDFKPAANQDKMIVTQARHTWVNSKAAEIYPEKYFKEGAKLGFKFLKEKMWDSVYGGFYTMEDKEGNVKQNGAADKEAYGNAFGIYALAAYYHESGNAGALQLAKEAFGWMEKHSHDNIYKGYYQHLKRDGTPIKRTDDVPTTSDLGYKDQNSSIHLLEALTELYAVSQDPLVRERLNEMLLLIRDTITTKRGNLVLFFKPDWTPVSFIETDKATILKHHFLDHVSFGHDIETAYLMLEASHALGIKNDTTTLRVGKTMLDHALNNGWDKQVGGFYDEGYYFKNDAAITITRDTKNWWAQAEGMNTLLLMSEYYPNDGMQYFEKFKMLWKYIQTYLIDHEHGDWYEGGLDKQPELRKSQKGHIWKATYHNFRALDNCIRMLKK
ncbi:MAG: AGE family epimerase/isomerase [Agriterribacter sp.]